MVFVLRGRRPSEYVDDWLVIAAAAKYEDQSKNDDPGAGIVKDVAKAVVVIHNALLL